MANVIFNEYKEGIITGVMSITSETDLKIQLVNNTNSTTIDETLKFEDFSSILAGLEGEPPSSTEKPLVNVSVGAGTAGPNPTDDTFKLTADNPEWGTSEAPITVTATGAIIYKVVDSANKLICYVDFGGAKSATNGIFKITWNSNGIITYKQGS